ncbi:DUF2249 domain-containing protein [Ectothiorhodospiraceae bacterium BW-2]|nr:DUF2249 domain-containing protein [Ectothiorhodospiraceae bacterium BW-2]
MELDVSELEPCEPMMQIRAALEQLTVGESLVVYHRMEPVLLYPTLEQHGFSWRCETGVSHPVKLTIWRSA